MSIAITVPILPRGSKTAKISHWYKFINEVVARDELLVELIVLGHVIRILAPQAAIVEKIFFSPGDVIEIGTVIASLKIGLPNLVWVEGQQTLILENYQVYDKGMTPDTDYQFRQLLRQGEGTFGKGFGSALALPQNISNAQEGHQSGAEHAAANQFKPHPALSESSQFAGVNKNPDVTMVPSNPGAQVSPQMAPNLAPKPQPSPGPSPTPKPG